jgi:hypothetical protein
MWFILQIYLLQRCQCCAYLLLFKLLWQSCAPPVSARVLLLLNVTHCRDVTRSASWSTTLFPQKERAQLYREVLVLDLYKNNRLCWVSHLFSSDTQGKLRKVTYNYGLTARSTFYITHQSVSIQTFDVKCHRTWHTNSALQYRNIVSRIWCMEVWRKTLNIPVLFQMQPIIVI